MAGRSLRPRKAVNYTCLNQSGTLSDSTDDEDHESEGVFTEEAQVEDAILSSREDEDPDLEETGNVFAGRDGTQWTTRVPRAPLDAWRFSLQDFQDGPKNEANVPENKNRTKLDFFKLMISHDTTKIICNWTNKWAHFCVRNWNKNHPTGKPRLWRDVTVTEILGFFGLILLGGVEKAKKKPWTEMWTKNEKYRNPAFVATMSRDRFFSLMSVIRFDDAIERHRLSNLPRSSNSIEDNDKLDPIRKVFEAITSIFAELYTPAAKLCIDEQLLIVYTGKEGNQREIGLGKNVVLKLVKQSSELHSDTTKNLPKSSTFLFNEDHTVTLVRHNSQKNNFVLLLSSAHFDNDRLSVPYKKGQFDLPIIIDYYNSNKFGVDTADQMIGNYRGQYPSKRWPMKLLVHLLDCVALNACIIWTRNSPLWNNAHKSSRRKFIRELANELITPQIQNRATTVANLPGHTRSAMKIMGIDTQTNIRQIQQQSGDDPGQRLQGRCSFDPGPVRQKKVSRRKCKKCEAWICEEHWRLLCPTCFELYSANQLISNVSPNTSAASDE
ncbi:unnamed protein product [Allacma fusca]|uniref:PiggyBac transposable element-derived protein domain-containing protein n=1 Tax=Allacma fusca TaxID=39272 RepID=A0A8J2L0S5_9HEXA|nr:unnamed protein product [Allacma fusca]